MDAVSWISLFICITNPFKFPKVVCVCVCVFPQNPYYGLCEECTENIDIFHIMETVAQTFSYK